MNTLRTRITAYLRPCLWLALFVPLLLNCGPAQARPRPAEQYLNFALASCDKTAAHLPEIERVAEVIAQRHIGGGMIGFIYHAQGLEDELMGRAGGMMHVAFERPWSTTPRTDLQKTNDVVIVGWQRKPINDDIPKLQAFRKAGCYIIGFGPRAMPELANCVPLCDTWFDTGYGAEDGVVSLSNGAKAGHANLMVEMLDGWCLTAEIVSALTRQGKMPTMWKSFSWADGREWMDKYYGKKQFHDDVKIAPIPAGQLSNAYLNEIRAELTRFKKTQLGTVAKNADLIAAETKAGRKTMVAFTGHSPYSYIGNYEDKIWCTASEFDDGLTSQVPPWEKNTADGALVLRLGYAGVHQENMGGFRAKKQRVMLIAVPNPRPEWKLPDDPITFIDDCWEFGDACVSIKDYPIRIFPPSGIMQMAAYQGIAVEVAQRLVGWTAPVMPAAKP